MPSDGSAPIRLAFYEIVVALLPPLLGVFLRERRAEIRSRAELHRRAQDALRKVDASTIEGDEVTKLRDYVEAAPRLLKAATAFTAMVPAAVLTGEAIGLIVVATGSSTMFSFAAVLMAVEIAGVGAVMETAQGFAPNAI